MVTPGDGGCYPSTDHEIDFIGAVPDDGTPVFVQALHPTRGWETIAYAVADWPYYDHNGRWYTWSVEQRIPPEYWTPVSATSIRRQATVRAVTPSGIALYTFRNDYPWLEQALGYYDEGELGLDEIWERWGHGTSVTIYANELPEVWRP
jgi:hypothetical protein